MRKKKSPQITTERIFTVLYEPVGKKAYQVTVPLLPGLLTYGRTFEEARTMARDAIDCYIGALKKDRHVVPTETSLLQEQIRVYA